MLPPGKYHGFIAEAEELPPEGFGQLNSHRTILWVSSDGNRASSWKTSSLDNHLAAGGFAISGDG